MEEKPKGLGPFGWLLLAGLIGGNGYLYYRESQQKGYIKNLMLETYEKAQELLGQKQKKTPASATTERAEGTAAEITEDKAAEINTVLSSVGDIEVPSAPVVATSHEAPYVCSARVRVFAGSMRGF